MDPTDRARQDYERDERYRQALEPAGSGCFNSAAAGCGTVLVVAAVVMLSVSGLVLRGVDRLV